MNIIGRLRQFISNTKESQHKADLVITSWKAANESVYEDFKQRIQDVADKGDMTILYDMYNLMKRCTPPEALDFYTWVSQTLSGKRDSTTIDNKWAGKYTDDLDKCIANKKLWLGINIRTGEAKICHSKQKGLFMIHSDTPAEIWDRLPQQLKSYIIEQTDNLADNSRDVHFSQMEREQLRQFLAFMARIIILSHSVFLAGFIANLYDEVIEKKEPLAYCMYYFVVFDDGLRFMAEILNSIMQSEDVDSAGVVLINTCIHLLVGKSIDMRVQTKEEWAATAKGSNEEIWKEIMLAINRSKGNRGNKRTICSIDELLEGNVSKIKAHIKEFIEENSETICLAYLLIALQRSGCVQQGCKYMTFHRAIEAFTGKIISYDVPQKRYGELKDRKLSVEQYISKDQRAKEIIDDWTPVFSRAFM